MSRRPGKALLLTRFSAATGSFMLQDWSQQPLLPNDPVVKAEDWCRDSKPYIGPEDTKGQSTMSSTSGARTIIFWEVVNQVSKTAFLSLRHNPYNAEGAPQKREDLHFSPRLDFKADVTLTQPRPLHPKPIFLLKVDSNWFNHPLVLICLMDTCSRSSTNFSLYRSCTSQKIKCAHNGHHK